MLTPLSLFTVSAVYLDPFTSPSPVTDHHREKEHDSAAEKSSVPKSYSHTAADNVADIVAVHLL